MAQQPDKLRRTAPSARIVLRTLVAAGSCAVFQVWQIALAGPYQREHGPLGYAAAIADQLIFGGEENVVSEPRHTGFLQLHDHIEKVADTQNPQPDNAHKQGNESD